MYGVDRKILHLGLVFSITGIFWLVGFGFNGPLRQYFSLYRAVSQREGERGKKERIDLDTRSKTSNAYDHLE